MRVPVKLEAGASLPEYATPGAAGADLRTREAFTLEPMARRLVATGLRFAIPNGYEIQVRPRSGLALKHGVAMVNAPGTIDSDYRGEVGALLINLGTEPVSFAAGERIGQIVMCPVERIEWDVVPELDATMRGEGGFGSTGA